MPEIPPGGLKQVAAMKKARLPDTSNRTAALANRAPNKEVSYRGAIQRRLNRGQKR